MIIYSNTKLRYAQVYYDETYVKDNLYVDIIREYQYSIKRFGSQLFTTLHIDLGQNEDYILSRFDKNTRYEINRARDKDGIVVGELTLPEEKQLFYDFYSLFSTQKSLPSLGTKEIDLLINSGSFMIRFASDQNGDILVYHTYICMSGRARLSHSVSLYRDSNDNARRNLIGRANRYLHWVDICYFKNKGFSVYDLGGINPDAGNHETLAINKFKECFGGVRITEYNSLVPVSLKGLLYFIYQFLKGKLV